MNDLYETLINDLKKADELEFSVQKITNKIEVRKGV